MKCFLHIGTEKTATKTIQNFLNLNRNKLYENKYIYTKSAGKVNNRKLALAAYNLNRRDDFTRELGIRSNQTLLEYQNNIIDKLKQEISHSKDGKVIFSSEHFQSRLTKIKEIKRLKVILNNLGLDDISVIVYLRNPADIASSLYSTAVKCGQTSISPPDPTHRYYANICDHRNTLEKFGSVFGEAALKPRIFHKNEFKNGSIIDDFLAAIEIDSSARYEIPQNKNESLSVLGIEILRRINVAIPRFIGDKPNPLRPNIVQYFIRHFSNGKYIMPEKLFHKYDAEFHESNEWVRKKFFPDNEFLFPQSPYPNETKVDLSEDQLDALANIISNIWNIKQKKILNLTKQLQ